MTPPPKRAPSIFILVPGPWRKAEDVQHVLRGQGISHVIVPGARLRQGDVRVDIVEDSDFAAAFRWGRTGPVADDLLERISRCKRAALIECGFLLDESPMRLAEIGRALRDAGGTAVRMEASGSASAWEPWIAHLESGERSRLYMCSVVIARDRGGTTFTCGMHHFDLPDAQIAIAEPSEAIGWLDAFCVYVLTEQPALISGHTFRPTADGTRRVIERWPDHRHDPADGRHNPFGLWRFLEPGATGIAPVSPVPVIIPPLVALLLAAESKAARPLLQVEVERLVAKSAAMAMEPRDLAAVERARGYADIEPERAWEQWQIVRRTLKP